MADTCALDRIIDAATNPGPSRLCAAISAIVIDASGKTLYSHADGTFGASSSKPVTVDSVFPIASMTKLVSAVVGLTLVAQGLVTLDADLSDYLEDIKNAKVVVQDGDQVKLVEKEGKVTMRNCMTHSSGMAYPGMDLKLKQWEIDENGKPISIFDGNLDSSKGMLKLPMSFQPDKGWCYAPGYDHIGILATKLTGLSLEEYCRKWIWDPLGMSHTTFHPDVRFGEDKHQELLVPISTADTNGKPGDLVDCPDAYKPGIPASWEAGGHGLYSSPSDYAKLLVALLDGNERVIPKSLVEEMFLPQFKDRSYYNAIVAPGSPMREVLAGVYDNGDGSGIPELDFGLGGSMNMADIPGRRKKGSINWGGAVNTLWWMDKESGIGGVWFPQHWPPSPELGKVFKAWEKEVYSAFV